MFTNNYSITQLFFKKEIKIVINNSLCFYMYTPTVADFLENEEMYKLFEIINFDTKDIDKRYGLKLENKFQLIEKMFFQLKKFKEFFNLTQLLERQLQKIFKNKLYINYKTNEFTIETNLGSIIITPEIWDYIVYLLQLIYGKKAALPPVFNTPEERKFYEAQQAAEKRIANLRSKNAETDGEFLIKMLLAINYSFPSLTFDYLFNQTMAQIQWLYNYALESVSYEVSAQACAAGNMKKNKKLEFFIK